LVTDPGLQLQASLGLGDDAVGRQRRRRQGGQGARRDPGPVGDDEGWAGAFEWRACFRAWTDQPARDSIRSWKRPRSSTKAKARRFACGKRIGRSLRRCRSDTSVAPRRQRSGFAGRLARVSPPRQKPRAGWSALTG
jgi:hypothetical protein